MTLVLFVHLVGCQKDVSTEIEGDLQAYFDDFVDEANAHGVHITLDNIDIGGYIENIETQGTLGQCKSYSNGSKEIVIDQPYWNQASDMEREYIVFHELGHCLLGREHLDIKDTNGQCTSIMQSGNGKCKGIYNLSNREKLLDELFEN